MRHSLLLLLGFSAVAAAFTVSTSRHRSTARHQGRQPERVSESTAKRDFDVIRRNPNRFANPNAASELRPFRSIYFLNAQCLRHRILRERNENSVGGLRCRGQLGRSPAYQFASERNAQGMFVCIYPIKSMLISTSFSFGIFLQLRMVAKTTLFFGERSPFTARVGATTDRNPCQDERRTGLLVPRGLFAGEWGTANFLHPIPHIGVELRAYSLLAGSSVRQSQPRTLTAGRIWDICSGLNNPSGQGFPRVYRTSMFATVVSPNVNELTL
jgi:hypothetical protein